VKQHEADGRTIFSNSFDFYIDCLNKSDHKKILADIDAKIQGMKREIDEVTKIEVENIKNFEDFMSSPDRHFKQMQETSDKLFKAEKEKLAAER
jgi:hypothetical protein